MNNLKKALLGKKLTIGTWIQSGSTVSAEILANLDYDWIAVDCEHSDIDIHSFSEISRAIDSKNKITIARVRENDKLAIRQVLDMGAKGIIVPLVETPEEARRAVEAAKYPPMGVRGFGYARANSWGADFNQYVASANDEISVIVMIESKKAVENIDAILEVKGVDGVFIGPYDMTGSYGCVGDLSNPAIVQACKRIANSCAVHKKAAGQHIVYPTSENIKKAIDDGYTFIALSTDIVFIDKSARSYLDLVKSYKDSK